MRLSLKTLGICLGIVFVLVYAAFSLWTFHKGLDSYVGFLPYATFGWMPLMIIVLAAAGWAWRKSVTTGVIPYTTALKYAFLAYIIYELGYALVNIIIYNILDKGFNHAVTMATLQKDLDDSAKRGMPLDEIKDSIAKEKASPSGPYTFFQLLLGFGMGLIVDFLKSMLVAVFVQRKAQPGIDTSADFGKSANNASIVQGNG